MQKKLKPALSFVIMLALPFLVSFSILADSPNKENKGYQLAFEVDRRDQGYGNIVVLGEIENISNSGAVNKRGFKMVTAEQRQETDRRLVLVTSPPSLKGTVFLTHPHMHKPDDTWMLLPGRSKLRRMSMRDKTGRFLGSEFTLEDIAPWELNKYDYSYQGTRQCQDEDTAKDSKCAIIVNMPKFESAYSKQVEYLDLNLYQPNQITYFDASGRSIKRLEFKDYIKIGQYWRPQFMQMTNLVTGDRSILRFSQYQLGAGYDAQQLVPQNLTNLVR